MLRIDAKCSGGIVPLSLVRAKRYTRSSDMAPSWDGSVPLKAPLRRTSMFSSCEASASSVGSVPVSWFELSMSPVTRPLGPHLTPCHSHTFVSVPQFFFLRHLSGRVAAS